MDEKEWEMRTRVAQLCTVIGTEYRRCGNREVPEQMMHRAEAQLALGGVRIFDVRGSTLRGTLHAERAKVFAEQGDTTASLFASLRASMAAWEGYVHRCHPGTKALELLLAARSKAAMEGGRNWVNANRAKEVAAAQSLLIVLFEARREVTECSDANVHEAAAVAVTVSYGMLAQVQSATLSRLLLNNPNPNPNPARGTRDCAGPTQGETARRGAQIGVRGLQVCPATLPAGSCGGH